MTVLRYLTEEGISRFESYLDSLIENPKASPPLEALTDSDSSAALSDDYFVEQRLFANKLGMARYVSENFAEPIRERNTNARGVWAWLSLFWIDQLIPPQPTGERKPNKSWYYIPSTSHYAEYRHLLAGPYRTYKTYGDQARLLLIHPLYVWSDIEEQTAGKREFLRVRGALAAADILYFDAKKNRPKTGITNRNKPGTIRRLNALVKQFALTYDLYSMNGQEVVAILPPEFDTFRA